MSSSTPTRPEPAKNAILNAFLVPLPLLSAQAVMLTEEELPESTKKEDKPVSVNPDFTPLSMAHAFSPTVTPILSALSVNMELRSALSVLLPETES